ncbi:MAG: pyridoxal phosphate-dependent aminotransferase [Desulfarculales bacterium]|jgi:aspartate/methionine/tyrosine aminotransferase|nr:pyridoxal phosphate-dependent aminotransferase [Desulfarculales bacterium]
MDIASKRATDIQPFIVMDVLEKAVAMQNRGIDIIHLEVGEPDFNTPECIQEGALKALAGNKTHYTHSLGIMELRQAIAGHYRKRYKVGLDPEQIMISAGSSPAMLLLFSALLEEGDEVIVSDPCYSCYLNFIKFAGGKPVSVAVSETDAFQYKPEDIAARLSPQSKAIVINSPANPTGQLLSPERMQAIAALADGKNGPPYVVSDEIYHGLIYDKQRDHCILEFTPHAFVLGGFSKLQAMTGWRLGYLIAPPAFIRPLQKMHQNFAICAPSISQWAALEIFRQPERVGEDIKNMLTEYDRRRLRLVQGLRDLGFSIPVAPQGAFYVFTRCDHLNPNDYDLAFHILEHAHVAVTPGRDFGPGGHGFIRLSYANSLENIEEALKRLKAYLKEFYPSQAG